MKKTNLNNQKRHKNIKVNLKNKKEKIKSDTEAVERNNKAIESSVYKMIDFSKEDGQLFIAIKHNCSNNKNLTIQLRSREHNNIKVDIPSIKYGSYLEASINVDELFSVLDINEKSVWDIHLYNNGVRLNLSIEPFKNFMVDYYPLKERLFIVKPYVTGMGTIALFMKKETIKFTMNALKENSDNYSLSIGMNNKYIKNIDSRIKEATIYFKKRERFISKDKYLYCKDTLSKVNSHCIKNNKLEFNIDFKKVLKHEVLPTVKNPLDGFIKIVDIKGAEIELPLVIKTEWKDKPYIDVNGKVSACLFKNYLDALSICTNYILK